MSTIAPVRKVPTIATPPSSSRPSIDNGQIRSSTPSPNRGSYQPRRNRSALREYYNIKKEEKPDDVSSDFSISFQSEVQEGDMDRDGFDGEAYVKHALETQSLEELMKTYNQVLTEIRALDAEKKALVYDNYSKLIAATETIRQMRANMDPLNPMASTLDPVIAHIYETADAVKSQLRASLLAAQQTDAETSEEEKVAIAKRAKSRELVRFILDTPERLRCLVVEGKVEEAKREWEAPLKQLEKWKAEGVGGGDVQNCIDDGDAALRGEPPDEKSWANIKFRK